MHYDPQSCADCAGCSLVLLAGLTVLGWSAGERSDKKSTLVLQTEVGHGTSKPTRKRHFTATKISGTWCSFLLIPQWSKRRKTLVFQAGGWA